MGRVWFGVKRLKFKFQHCHMLATYLLWTENLYVEDSLVPQNVTVSGNGSFKETTKVK